MNSTWLDGLGSASSAACAAHCAVFAFAPALAAVLGIQLLANEAYEWGFFAAAMTFAVASSVLGWRIHRRGMVALGFAAAATLLVLGRLGEAWSWFERGALFAVLGGLGLIASHVANARSLRACRAECAS